MENKFKKGLLLGGLLAAGALVGLSMTQKGQELTEELKAELKILTKKLKKRLADLEDISKEKYNELVTTVVQEYAEKKTLAKDAEKKIMTALQKKWDEMEEAYRNDQE